MKVVLYVTMKQSVEIDGQAVAIKDVCKLYCENKNVVSRLSTIKLFNDKYKGRKAYVVSIMKIVEEATKLYPGIDVTNLGASECVVDFKDGKKTPKSVEMLKVAFICLIMFFGAGFSIMSFNNDVSISEMFKQMCYLLTGNENSGKLLIESCYAIGIGLGLLIFYNHFGKKNITKDPTPIEIEMRKYEQDINQTVIDANSRNDGKLDVE